MIQSTSPVRAAAATVEPAQPVSARAVPGQPAGNAVRGFSERMRFAAGDNAAASREHPAPSLPGALPAVVTEPAAMPFNSEPTAETAELGLLEIIEQQLAEIEAREALQGDAVPAPLLPLATAEIDRAGERLGWSSNPLPPLPGAQAATRQAEPLDFMQDSGWQGRTVEADPVVSTGSRFGELKGTARAPADLPASPPQPQQPLPQLQPLSAQAPLTLDTASRLSTEPLLATAEPLEAGDPLLSTERAQAAPPQALDRTLKLRAPEARWGEQMLHALRENVELQIQQKIQSATIRLDPPELGSMEILLSHESGRLNVQLTAVNADVARLLQQSSDRLRQELVGQHFVQVNVQVGADSGGQQGQQRHRAALAAEELPLAARTLEEEQQDSRAAERARDVLVTV